MNVFDLLFCDGMHPQMAFPSSQQGKKIGNFGMGLRQPTKHIDVSNYRN
jgi:hypothetical protein